MRKIIRKMRRYRGKPTFSYYYENGVRITDKELLVKLKGLRIPPAWTNVQINLSKNVNRIVVGLDTEGRKQSIYSKKFVLKKRKERMCNIADLILVLPSIRRTIDVDIHSRSRRTRAIATIVKMMDTCCPLRIGNDIYRRRYNTYGLSTLEKKHLTLMDDGIMIQFIGKKHMENKKWISKTNDPLVYESLLYFYKNIKRIRDADGKYRKPIFSYCSKPITSCDINEYIQKYGNFSAKDFRTLRANVELLKALGVSGMWKTKTEMVRKRNNALDIAAEALNNTRAICKSSYVLKPILTMYETKPKSLLTKISRTNDMESVLHGLLVDCSRKRASNF